MDDGVKVRRVVMSQRVEAHPRVVAIARPAFMVVRMGTARVLSSGKVNCDVSRVWSSEPSEIGLEIDSEGSWFSGRVGGGLRIAVWLNPFVFDENGVVLFAGGSGKRSTEMKESRSNEMESVGLAA